MTSSTVITLPPRLRGCDPEILRLGELRPATAEVRNAATAAIRRHRNTDRYTVVQNHQACDTAIRRCKAKGLREPIVLLIELRDLAVHFDNGGIVWPCQHLLAERCRVSVRTIRRWIKKLEEHRILRVWRQRPHRDEHGRWTRKTNRYLTPLASKQFAPRGHARPHDPSLIRKGAGERATAPPRSLLNGSFLQQEGEPLPMAVSKPRWAGLRASMSLSTQRSGDAK